MSRQTTETTTKTASSPPAAKFDGKLIEALAYQNWLERGCPIGSDQADWFQAEAQLRASQPEQQAG